MPATKNGRRFDATTQIRLPSPMLEAAQERAEAKGLSLGSVLRMLLAEWLESPSPMRGSSEEAAPSPANRRKVSA
jgi:predicted DNA binding CopG/RHH family protein